MPEYGADSSLRRVSTPVARTLEPANWYERRVLVADSIIAAIACFVLGLFGANIVGQTYSLVYVVVPLGMCAVLAIRRSKPEVYVATAAALAVFEMAVIPPESGMPTDLLVLVAVHTAARYCPKWFAYCSLALGLLGAVWASWRWVLLAPYDPALAPQIVGFLVSVGIMWMIVVISFALGRAQRAKVRAMNAQVAALADRNRLLQHEHEQQLRLATEEERGRLAAETHDILAHSLAIIVAQADGAAMLVANDPARAQQAIEQIADTSREALDEIRVKVAALRRGEDPSSELAPAKTLSDLPALIENVGRTGLSVELATDGDLAGIPAGTSLSAYRIIQEALTNTLKHAGPKAHATVSISRVAGALQLAIEDDGRGTTAADGAGNGLRGMRARVEQYGGVLSTGARVGGGFAVRAAIPLPLATSERAT